MATWYFTKSNIFAGILLPEQLGNTQSAENNPFYYWIFTHLIAVEFLSSTAQNLRIFHFTVYSALII